MWIAFIPQLEKLYAREFLLPRIADRYGFQLGMVHHALVAGEHGRAAEFDVVNADDWRADRDRAAVRTIRVGPQSYSSAGTGSQESGHGSVPLVPPILTSGLTIPEPCPRTSSMKPKRYMITWNDTPAIDGEFMLVVHPTQLFLRSGHNNPNPNYVYWVQELSEGQYAQFARFLDVYRGPVFRRVREVQWPGYTLFSLNNPRISPWRPDRMTPDSEVPWQSRSDAAVNSNLQRILKELNRGLSEEQPLRVDAAINRYPKRIAE